MYAVSALLSTILNGFPMQPSPIHPFVFLTRCSLAIALCLFSSVPCVAADLDTFPPLDGDSSPQTLDQMWGDFDPRAEPLETEILHQWEEDGVVLRVVRFRVGVFKGTLARVAAVYGFPKGAKGLPGLVQIHGGGQYADANACLANAKRGYATVSIAWAGRISSSEYRVDPNGVQLYWDGKTQDANYRLTTDWGAVDGYHAPSRNKGNQFPSAKPHPWTLDTVESPRNSGWFLCAVAARRALTFMEQQPEVDANRLGIYGHSMGGKITVLTAPDPRVKAAAPSCGGISDRDNASEIFRHSLGDAASLEQIHCPIIFLSPSNDFHGRIVDLPNSVKEIKSQQWRVICSPQHNHQDTAEYEVATMLWFDQFLRGQFLTPKTPEATLRLNQIPTLEFTVDDSMPIKSVDVYYTQHAKKVESGADRDLTMNRFWHHVSPRLMNGRWLAELPISSTTEPILAFANVTYQLAEPVSGAGYYYRLYTADSFQISSLLQAAWPDELAEAKVQATLKPTTMIETFDPGWRREWFSYRPEKWSATTHKLHDGEYAAPQGAQLALEVRTKKPNDLVLLIDEYAASVPLTGEDEFQQIVLSPSDFADCAGTPLESWETAKRLKLTELERLRPKGGQGEARVVGKPWQGEPPQFRNLQWLLERDRSDDGKDRSAEKD